MSNTALSTTWDDSRNVDLLRTMWLDGKSASEIALAIPGATRNAVIGKVHRMKLGKRASPAATKSRVRTASGREGHRGRSGGLGQSKANSIINRVQGRMKAALVPKLPEDDEGVDVTALIGIMDLNEHTCRWPIGDPLDPSFGFCGKEPVEGKPYCEDHCRRAFGQQVPVAP